MALADMIAKAEAGLAQAQNAVSAVQPVIAGYEALLADLKAEEARVPTLDDVRALLDRIAAGQAKT